MQNKKCVVWPTSGGRKSIIVLVGHNKSGWLAFWDIFQVWLTRNKGIFSSKNPTSQSKISYADIIKGNGKEDVTSCPEMTVRNIERKDVEIKVKDSLIKMKSSNFLPEKISEKKRLATRQKKVVILIFNY